MKLLNYDDFLNEKLSPINEAMNVSDELKKVKTLEDFMNVVKDKVLIITSYYEFITSLSRTPKKSKYEETTVFSNFQGNICRDISHFYKHRDGITFFVEKVGRGSINGINSQDISKIFDYFMFCKKKGSVIRLTTMNELQSGATEIYKKSKAIMDKVKNILSVKLPSDKKVPVSAVTHLKPSGWSDKDNYQFELDRATYSVTFDKTGIDADVQTIYFRNLHSNGTNLYVYKVGIKDKKQLLNLANERKTLGDECIKWAKNFMQKYTK